MASKSIYVHLDMNKNELQNAVIQNLAAAPGSPVEGQIYYDNSVADKKLYFWDGSAWVSLGGAAVTDHGALTGLSDDDHTQYLHLTPGSSTRNTLMAAGAFIPLQIKASATQGTNALIEFDDNSNVTMASVGADGKFFAPGGTNALPGYSFTGDPNTGLYSDAGDTVKVATNGTLRFTVDTSNITSTLPVLHPNGSLSNVAMGFTADPNTGIYTSGTADTFSLVTGGTAVVTLNTATVTTTLPVVGPNGSLSNVAFGFSGDPNTGIYSTGTADTFALVTNATARLTLNTASITATLPFLAADGSAANPAYSFTDEPDTGMYQTNTANEIGFSTGGSNRLTIADTVITVNGIRVTGLATPTAASDAVTKSYVDGLANGVDWKASVRVATTAAGTLATSFENGDSIDGVTLATGDRILIKDQAAGAENGIYTVNASGAPTRATDADASAEVTGGMAVWVNEGTTNGDSGWILTTNDAITLGTTALVFTQFSGLGQITAGAGLTKTGNTIDAVGTSNRITVNANDIDIAATYVGQTSITTLGTIATGTWSATAIAADKGGTGQTSYAIGDILYASSSSALSKLAGVATGNALISGGVGTAPSWGKIALTTHVSGILPIANGGTNADGTSIGASNKFLHYDGTRVTATAYDNTSFATAAHNHDTIYTKTFAATIGDASSTTLGITHNFNTKDVIVQVYRVASPYDTIECEVDRNGVNTCNLIFNVAPATNEYRVVVIGIDG